MAQIDHRRIISSRDRAFSTLKRRATTACENYPVAKLKVEIERLFGVKPCHMTERQMHLCITWLTCLNVLALAPQALRSCSTELDQ